MMKKIVGIFVCMLFIATIVLPVLGVNIGTYQKYIQSGDFYELEFEIDTDNPNDILGFSDIYEIYEGEYFAIGIGVRWFPPNVTRNICLWADNITMPAGARLTPPCNCGLGEVSSVFEWTPAVGQAGTYFIRFFAGMVCGSPLGFFIIQIIVLSSGQDDPPLVVIQSPENGTTFNSPDITLTGYATDDIGLLSIGFHHEWTGDETIISGTIPQTTYYPFSGDFNLHEGWNRITVFVSDTKNQHGEDQIVVYYEISTNQPPNKPSKPTGLSYGKVGVSYTYESRAIDNDSDLVYYMFDWADGTDSGWIGPYYSGDTCQVSHIWNTRGSYSVKVKAKDVHNAESVWSDPLSITMPKIQSYNLIIQQLFKILERFSFL
jgi:hypothetical protein